MALTVLKIDLSPFVAFDLDVVSQFFSIVNSFLIFSLLLNGGMIMVLRLILRFQNDGGFTCSVHNSKRSENLRTSKTVQW